MSATWIRQRTFEPVTAVAMDSRGPSEQYPRATTVDLTKPVAKLVFQASKSFKEPNFQVVTKQLWNNIGSRYDHYSTEQNHSCLSVCWVALINENSGGHYQWKTAQESNRLNMKIWFNFPLIICFEQASLWPFSLVLGKVVEKNSWV